MYDLNEEAIYVVLGSIAACINSQIELGTISLTKLNALLLLKEWCVGGKTLRNNAHLATLGVDQAQHTVVVELLDTYVGKADAVTDLECHVFVDHSSVLKC